MRNVEAQSFNFLKTSSKNYDSNINNKHSLTQHYQKDQKGCLRIENWVYCEILLIWKNFFIVENDSFRFVIFNELQDSVHMRMQRNLIIRWKQSATRAIIEKTKLAKMPTHVLQLQLCLRTRNFRACLHSTNELIEKVSVNLSNTWRDFTSMFSMKPSRV